MNAPWSAQQREWLQALGHDVLMLGGAKTPPQVSGTAVTSVLAVIAPRRPPPAAATPSGSPLLRALLRAAGRRDLGELAWLPDPASLRGNAAAKRALWPRLRTLRKPPGDA